MNLKLLIFLQAVLIPGCDASRRNSNNFRYADDTTLMAENGEELKTSWWGKRQKWKSWLETQHSKNKDHGIWSHYFLANRWGKSGNSDRFYFLGLQITVDSDCSHEIKKRLLLGRKAMTNLDSIFKSRYHFADKGPYSQSYSFSNSDVWMWAGT